jgi:hypothetical protein
MAEQIRSVAMATYRFFAVDELDAVKSVQWIDCTDDANATEMAKSLRTEVLGVEAWDVGRRVCKISAHWPALIEPKP